jgi:hypothetical protein
VAGQATGAAVEVIDEQDLHLLSRGSPGVLSLVAVAHWCMQFLGLGKRTASPAC